MFGILASIAEFEHELIRERVRSGLAVARARGKRLGRPPSRIDAEKVAALREQGDLAGAKKIFEESLVIEREVGSKQAVAIVLENIGEILHKQRAGGDSRTLPKAQGVAEAAKALAR